MRSSSIGTSAADRSRRRWPSPKTLRLSPTARVAVWSTALLLVGCAGQPANTHRLTVLHTNDIHGQFIPRVEIDGTDTILVGGFEALSHFVREARQRSDRVLLLDAGDVMTGNLICDMEYDGALGGGLIAMMNRIGYDALVPGNHMFDHSLANMRALDRVASFPFVCANLVRDQELVTGKPYDIVELDGLKIGVIGVTYHPMVGMVPEPNLEGFVSGNPLASIAKYVPEVDSQTDVIILLSHAGLEGDRTIARGVYGVDLIVGGHSHRVLDTLEQVHDVLIAQAGSQCRYLGVIDLEVADDRIVAHRDRLIPLVADGITPDTGVTRMAAEFERAIEHDYGAVIGELIRPWKVTWGAECNVGQWLTDAMRRRMGTDVAFLNTGGIRRNIETGPVRKMDIMEMLPFDNDLVRFECTGAQLLRIAAHNLGTTAEGASMGMQISGLTFSYRLNERGAVIVDASVDGVPIDSQQTYSVACIDYVVIHNSARYFSFKVDAYELYPGKLAATIIEEVERAGPIDARLETRARRLD